MYFGRGSLCSKPGLIPQIPDYRHPRCQKTYLVVLDGCLYALVNKNILVFDEERTHQHGSNECCVPSNTLLSETP